MHFPRDFDRDRPLPRARSASLSPWEIEQAIRRAQQFRAMYVRQSVIALARRIGRLFGIGRERSISTAAIRHRSRP